MDRATLDQLWSSMNLTDRLYFLWYVGLTVAILIMPHRVLHWDRYLLLHLLVLGAIVILAWYQARSTKWHFLHDWYPVLLFVIAFEEIARLSLLFRDNWQDHLIIEFERRLFSVPPTVWLERFTSPWLTEVMAIGYFSFYGFFVAVGGVLYARSRRTSEPMPRRTEAEHAFRHLVDATVIGYVICYLIYLFLPTESPARTLGHAPVSELPGGPFHWAVNLIQRHGGVHGNAFPSGHIMSSAVTLLFAFKYSRKLGWWLTPLFTLMCVSSVYDRYHYLSDVVGGAILGGLVAAPFLIYRDASRLRSWSERVMPNLDKSAR